MPALRHVEPEPPRVVRAVILRGLATPLNAALERSLPFRLIAWRLIPRLIRLTGGRAAALLPFPAAVLETRDARNGHPHRRALVYFHDGDRVILVASRGGGGRNPFWFENLRADPSVLLNGEPYRAEVVSDPAEQARLGPAADTSYPANVTHREHAARAGREIPLVALVSSAR